MARTYKTKNQVQTELFLNRIYVNFAFRNKETGDIAPIFIPKNGIVQNKPQNENEPWATRDFFLLKMEKEAGEMFKEGKETKVIGSLLRMKLPDEVELIVQISDRERTSFKLVSDEPEVSNPFDDWNDDSSEDNEEDKVPF